MRFRAASLSALVASDYANCVAIFEVQLFWFRNSRILKLDRRTRQQIMNIYASSNELTKLLLCLIPSILIVDYTAVHSGNRSCRGLKLRISMKWSNIFECYGWSCSRMPYSMPYYAILYARSYSILNHGLCSTMLELHAPSCSTTFNFCRFLQTSQTNTCDTMHGINFFIRSLHLILPTFDLCSRTLPSISSFKLFIRSFLYGSIRLISNAFLDLLTPFLRHLLCRLLCRLNAHDFSGFKYWCCFGHNYLRLFSVIFCSFFGSFLPQKKSTGGIAINRFLDRKSDFQNLFSIRDHPFELRMRS